MWGLTPDTSDMRLVLAASCLVAVTGCAAGADGVIAAKDAENGLAVKDKAVASLARTQLITIEQQAQAWSATNGSMTGFAADLQANQPAIAGSLAALTDGSISMSIGPGQCLTAALPSGAPTVTAC